MILFYLNMVPRTLHICDYNLKLSVPVILAESYVHWSVELTFPSHVAAKHAEFGIEAEVAHNWTTQFYLKLCGFCSVTFSFNGFFPSSNIELNMCRTQCKWTLTLAFAHLYWVQCMESVMLARQSALSQDHLSVAWILTRASCVPKIWIPIALYHYSGYTAQTSRFTPITFIQVYLNSNFNGTLYMCVYNSKKFYCTFPDRSAADTARVSGVGTSTFCCIPTNYRFLLSFSSIHCSWFHLRIVARFSPSVLSTSTLNRRRSPRDTVFIHKLDSEDRNLYNTSGSDLRSLWSSLSSCEDHFHLHSLSAVHIMWFMSCTHHSTFLLFKWTRNCT